MRPGTTYALSHQHHYTHILTHAHTLSHTHTHTHTHTRARVHSPCRWCSVIWAWSVLTLGCRQYALHYWCCTLRYGWYGCCCIRTAFHACCEMCSRVAADSMRCTTGAVPSGMAGMVVIAYAQQFTPVVKCAHAWPQTVCVGLLVLHPQGW